VGRGARGRCGRNGNGPPLRRQRHPLSPDQIVVGIAINLLAIGLTRFSCGSPLAARQLSRVAGFGVEQFGQRVRRPRQNPLVWLGIAAIGCVAWLLYRTVFGLAFAPWVSIRRPRSQSAFPSPAFAISRWRSRARWRPWAGVSCVGPAPVQRGDDGGARIHRTGGDDLWPVGSVPSRVGVPLLRGSPKLSRFSYRAPRLFRRNSWRLIPYVLTIVALAGVVGRVTPPAALGKVIEA